MDGANVGMFNQNFEEATFRCGLACLPFSALSERPFSFGQVERLMQHLRESRPAGAKPPLLVLHQRRVRGGPANARAAAATIQRWRSANELFTTPDGSNDDWYWLYAAVSAGKGGLLVSNDELRDHVFQARS